MSGMDEPRQIEHYNICQCRLTRLNDTGNIIEYHAWIPADKAIIGKIVEIPNTGINKQWIVTEIIGTKDLEEVLNKCKFDSKKDMWKVEVVI